MSCELHYIAHHCSTNHAVVTNQLTPCEVERQSYDKATRAIVIVSLQLAKVNDANMKEDTLLQTARIWGQFVMAFVDDFHRETLLKTKFPTMYGFRCCIFISNANLMKHKLTSSLSLLLFFTEKHFWKIKFPTKYSFQLFIFVFDANLTQHN